MKTKPNKNPNNKAQNTKHVSKDVNNEIRIYGESACQAVFRERPEDIIQLFYSKEKTKESPALIREMTTALAKNKKSYHMVDRAELEKLTKATHHEDICMLVKKKKQLSLDEYLKQKKNKSLLIVLEDVSNPHNIGAILRTSAHFGVNGLIVTNKKMAETASSIRVSEGGFEFVQLFETNNIGETLSALNKEKYQIVTTSSHAKKNLQELKWNSKCVIVFGEEANGLSKELIAKGECINIKGTDHVESLNVSVAASILMYDFHSKIK